MEFNQVSVMSIAHVDPPHRITSQSIDDRLTETMQRIGARPGLLEGLSGIRARRFWDEKTQPSQVAAEAGRQALERAGISGSQLGVIINTSVCRDFIEPSTACLVHGELGLPSTCLNFDLGNACLAFINGMEVAGQMIESGAVEYALVVDGEGSRDVTEATIARLQKADCKAEDFRAQFAALTLGSGAAGMVLARTDLAPEGHRFLGCVNDAATEWRHLCHGQRDFMQTDTSGLLTQGLKLAAKTWQRGRDERNWQPGHFDQFVIHQVSHVHTEKLCQTLGIEQERCYKIYQEFGNIGPAGVPITLSKAVDAGQIQPGDRVALLGIGSGLNCSMGEIVW